MAGQSRLVPVRMSDALLVQIDRQAALEGITRSALIRDALVAHLAQPRGLRLSGAAHRRLAEIAEKYGVQRLDLFGSRARGEAGPQSDIDLVYTLKPGVRIGWEIEDLNAELEDLLGSPVDLVARNALHPALQDQVMAEAEVLYAS